MRVGGWASRSALKQGLAPLSRASRARGTTILTYHRVGGGTPDERDVPLRDFAEQIDLLASRTVVPLDTALRRLDEGDDRPTAVITFDDGFADVYERAWPLLRAHGLPFTLYVATAFVGESMIWEGSTAREPEGPALDWWQLTEMVESGLCTIGNHTHRHTSPATTTMADIRACDEALEERLGVTPHHFAYTWGVPIPGLETALRRRFRSAVTGRVGRNLPATDRMRLRRLPVRGTDPLGFFEAKIDGGLAPERIYDSATRAAKRVGIRG